MREKRDSGGVDAKRGNVSSLLKKTAERHGATSAAISRESSLTFAELNALTDIYAETFRQDGLTAGTLTLMAVPSSIEMIAAVFAVFRVGAVPVLIDPGMGGRGFLACVKATQPKAMVGVPKAHWMSSVFPRAFRSVNLRFSIGGGLFPGAARLPSAATFKKRKMSTHPTKIEETDRDDMAAILFTSGATGPPKGVVYTHGIFIEQTKLIGEVYGAGPAHVDMPCFPLFGLFSAALGMPFVIPDFNPSFPAKADPALIVNTINRHNVSFSFASPTLWRNVATYCIAHDIRLPSLKKVLMAGAPVPPALHADLKKIIADDGDTFVPYGATEALPVANMTGGMMTAELAKRINDGEGYCVGSPLPGVEALIMKTSDTHVPEWNPDLEMPKGEIGEIVVSGPIVTPEYHKMPDHTALAKIKTPDGNVMHRMGDMGRVDENGRLWFLGRKTHRVFTAAGVMYPVGVEAVFNNHAHVRRSALVGIGQRGKQIPILVVEPNPGVLPLSDKERKTFIAELAELGKKHPMAKMVETFLFIDSLPVDIRHNAKIDRLALVEWAAKRSLNPKP